VRTQSKKLRACNAASIPRTRLAAAGTSPRSPSG
jgi:hypothetical protein